MSWKLEMRRSDTKVWETVTGYRFATQDEVCTEGPHVCGFGRECFVGDYDCHWDNYRPAPSSDPVNAQWDDGLLIVLDDPIGGTI
jgi:hypothetical protein